MKLKDIDNSLMEQDSSAEIPKPIGVIPTGLPPGPAAPPSTGGSSKSDFERNVLNTLNALGPGIGRAVNFASRAGTRLGLSQAGRELDQIKAAELAAKKADLVQQARAGAPFSSTRPSLSSGPNFDISAPVVTGPGRAAKDELASIMAKIDKDYPMSDFVKTGRRDPGSPITDKSVQFSQTGPKMGSYRDPATGRYARYTDDTPSGPALGTAADTASKNVATATARELSVPATKQSADLGVSARTKQVPGAGLPMPQTGLTPGQTAASVVAGAGLGAIGGGIYGLGNSTGPAPTTRPAGTPPAASAASTPAASAASSATGSSAMPTATPSPGVAVATGQGVRGGSPTSADISKQVQQLASASGITNPNQIKVGQQITLPGGGTYTVRPGDNLWNISKNVLRGTMREDQELSEIKRLSGV